MKYKFILFDLDGTISESGPGITKAIQYGLTAAGIHETDQKILESFIGPPLNVQIQKLYGLSKEKTFDVIMKFREQYDTEGVFDASPYPGVKELLSSLKDEGCILSVSSSKPWPLVEKILDNFNFSSYFDVITGSDPADEMKNKADFDQKIRIIRKTFTSLKNTGKTEEINDSFLNITAMIGDKSYDILGARANRITSIGITWGYGDREELKAAKADFIFDTPKALDYFFHT